MIKQECIGIPDMILLLMIFCFKKIKIKAEIVLSPGGAYFFRSRLTTPDPTGIALFQKRSLKKIRNFMKIPTFLCRV